MKPTDKIDQDGEDALQELAHEIEQVAEQIRWRAWRGRHVGDVAGASRALREVTQRVELLTHCD